MKKNIVAQLRSANPAILMMPVLAFLGALIGYTSTPWGVLVDTDSYFYLTAAKNFISGAGLGRLSWDGQLIPLTHYPPLYPILVGAFSLFTQRNVLLSARILACLLFGLNAFLFGFLIHRYTHSPWAGLAGTIVFLFSMVTLSVIVAGLSEGLFFVFLFLAFFCVTEMATSTKKAWLVGAAVCTALACLSRYVGVALILACLIPLLLLNQKPWRYRIGTVLVFSLISGLPIGLWYLRDWLLTGSATNRVIVFHWPGWLARNEAVLTAAGWLFPGKVTLESGELYLLLIGLIVLTLWGAWWLLVRKNQSDLTEKAAFRFSFVLISFILVYGVELLVSRTFLDASTRWNTRILSPFYITGLLLLTTIFWYGLRIRGQHLGKIALMGVEIYLVVLNLPQTATYLADYAKNGLGYTDAVMQKSMVMAFLELYPDTGRLYSNNAAALYFNLDRISDWIPEQYDSVKALPRSDYQDNLSIMRKDLQTTDSFLVIFKPYDTAQSYPPLNELTAGLVVLKDYKDATIYVYPSK